ncbi:hypothetical protein [Oharaeibacter diazotrophicus]|uniref:Uncharacterized protein n=1 Tax=Oharaeibacter diazotrophicus TaxID=1920512 RepID=A0A4R6RG42_9HYPH|nr:hypothetical protein [Oharaeibacter diazotrophicus]TDP85391.1 hypothetical protein EDD54_2244 [Oharaeibacter diazotrophicus]BBE74361.1 hypothetical protein OHA_1_03992 [Pleomorphomonas sp. SM30]GLS75946.1 hypothetical protein GCM10007904_12810 [Oharaeibacter diazotrophicus]
MSRTDDVLAALHAAMVDVFTAAGLPAPERDRAIPSAMIELVDGSEIYTSLFDGAGEVTATMLGDGAAGDIYDLTQRAEIDLAVADHDRARRIATFDAGLVAIDDATRALAAAVETGAHALSGVLTAVQVERVERSGTVFEGIVHIKSAVVTVALTYTSDRPF